MFDRGSTISAARALPRRHSGSARLRARRALVAVGVVVGCLALPQAGWATTRVLTFEGLRNGENVQQFYNGGAGSLGSIGPDYDIEFGAAARAARDTEAGGTGNFANEPSPDTIVFFIGGSGVVMNAPAGIDSFSFFYSSAAAASVTVYGGLDATGAVLATLPLSANFHNGGCTGDPGGTFCHWDPVGVTFAGTARSVSFGGAANLAGFDDITLGSSSPGDSTPPAVVPTIVGTLGDEGWYTSDVHLSWSVTDGESPIGSQAGCGPVDVTADQPSTDYTCTATSAGGSASQTASIQRDAHAPTVTVTGVSDGASYVAGSVPAAGCGTVDATSGVATAATLSTAGGPAGPVTATCSGAKDHAGNLASPVSVTYTVTQTYFGEVAADSPGWWWHLGESSGTTMIDAAGGANGNYQNGVVLGQPGAISGAGTAAKFDGRAAYGYVNGIAAPQQAYTMEIWMKAAPPLAGGTLMDQGGAGALYTGTDRFCFRQTQTSICWAQAPATDVWYHVAGTWDAVSQTARLYVNGVERASGQASSALSGSGTFYIGYGQSAPWFKGDLDEAAYYRTALSATRVAAHYHSGCGC